ncbi:YdeI/OmpD-associated family protein [Paenibacillus sp. P96]|uniref:YdeI/OmpD-associated family protein n=1 Tax=Paenibacillus zeirhizosphaerae TaxID=2987519 RepID=A0ABT9FNU5_9BACL|nr:YdeI/OmpD-associated family protein [Paenibacillus sp. P96]MDP4096407.1 YdeI/OmpD-associated family protein [Paenibacillus sp. P96]
MKFKSTLQLSKKTATGIEVPDEIVEGLGGGKKPPVKVTIGSYTYRSTIASMGGKFMLPVSKENREGAGIQAGDEIEVELELDTAPRELIVPDDFTEALHRHGEAQQFFEGLSYSNKRRFVLNIEGAKSAETRQRRIEKSVELLREGKLQ